MITTGIHIPQTAQAKLATAIAAIHRQTATMTISEFRKRYRQQRDKAAICCFFRIETTKTGAIKGFRAHMIDRPVASRQDDGFACDVPLVGRADGAAREIAVHCGEFLMQRELHRRAMRGERELVDLSQDQLEEALQELQPLQRAFSSHSACCGHLSERFRLAQIGQELETRARESAHERMTAIARNSAFLAACRQALAFEAEKAVTRRKQIENRGSRIFVSHEFKDRSEYDQAIIDHRDDVGWC